MDRGRKDGQKKNGIERRIEEKNKENRMEEWNEGVGGGTNSQINDVSQIHS